jgi:hypothetical protein
MQIVQWLLFLSQTSDLVLLLARLLQVVLVFIGIRLMAGVARIVDC